MSEQDSSLRKLGGNKMANQRRDRINSSPLHLA
jgi:hypothetical protein